MNGSPKSSLAWECGKLKNVGGVVHGRPTLLTIAKGGWSSWWTTHEWHPRSNMSPTKHVGDLGMNSYACWITFGGVKLIHIHWNRWACEPTKVASTYTSSLIQALICCHPSKSIGQESPNGSHFLTNMHMGAYMTIANVAQHESIPKINLTCDQKNLWPIPTCKRPWQDHPKMTKLIRPILVKFNAPSKVMLFNKECW